MKWKLAATLAAALLGAFGGGFGLAKWSDAASRPSLEPAAPEPAASVWRLFGHPRAADAPRAAVPRPDGFAVWTTRLDTSGPQPLACIRMTRPLDPSRSYADFVLVSPELAHAPAVSARGDELCIAGLGFGPRRVTLLRGLPDRAGDLLPASADVEISAGPGAPYVGFAGQGVILPRDESDGIGIETANVSRIAVEVWRVVDRNLVRKTLSAPSPTGEGEWPGDYGEDSPDDEGRVVWKGELAVHGDPAARATTVFPLGAVLKTMEPGAYVIKARDITAGRDPTAAGEDNSAAQARRWVMFTDMALTAYKGADGLDVVVRSLKTAKVIPGLAVSVVARDGETLGAVHADAQGRARFSAPSLAGQGALTPRMIMAHGAAGDLAVLDLGRAPVDLSRQPVGGRSPPPAIDGFLFSDRGVYRPGERAHLVALLRGLDTRAVGDRKGAIVIKRPSGVEFRRYAFASAPGGGVSADVDLPPTAPRGRWTAELRIEGLDDPAGTLGFSVEDFTPRRLAVTLAGHPESPVGAQPRAVDVSARFLYGAAGAGLQLQGEARIRTDPDPFPRYAGYQWGDETRPFAEKFVELGSSLTDGDGHARLVLAASMAGETADPLSAALTASVFEPGGRPVREGVTLKVRPRPVYLGVKVDPGEASGARAPLVGLEIIAVDALGQRVASPGVNWRLISEQWTYDWFQQDGRWQWRRSSREVAVASGVLTVGASGPTRLSRRLGWGDYRLELQGPDGARTVRRFSAGWGGPAEDAEAPDQARVSAGPASHHLGDTVEIAIKAPYAGEAQVAVATDRLIDFHTLTLGAGGGVVRLKTSPAWGGGAYVLVSVIQPRDPVSTPVPRRALGLVYVPLDPGSRRLTVDLDVPAKLSSKAPVVVPVRVRGLGLGQRARVTVAAVDEGILALTHFESPDPTGWYFGKRALGVDYRDDYGRILDANLGPPANVSFGGDELGGQGLTVTPTRTVALWSGVVRTGADGRVRVRLPAGDFNGQLRIMAVAWTDTAVGSASAPLTVREPVVAELDLPRFLSPGDRPVATLELHNLDGRAGSYEAHTLDDGGLSAPFSRIIPLAVGQRLTTPIPFAAPAQAGRSRIGLTVTGPGFATTRRYDIQTRLGWGAETRAVTALQRPGERFTPPANLLAGLAAGDVDVRVSYSPFLGFDPAGVALALSHYPYACSEQLVSSAYAGLYATTASGGPEGLRGVSDAVGQLIDRQSLDGAFGLWRVGDGEADPWLGAYVVDFLLEARATAVGPAPEVVERALSAMRQISRPEGFAAVSYRMTYSGVWAPVDPATARAATARLRSRASAYALYVLAKAGQGDLPRLRWRHDTQSAAERSPLALAQIGAGLALMGDHARARDSLVQAVAALGYKDPDDDYQSPLRDLAGVIALAYEAGAPDLARPLQSRLPGLMRDPDNLNTQEQAWLLRAARAMFRAAGPVRIDATGAMRPSGATASTWAVTRLADAAFINRGAGPIWRTVTVRGTPLRPPPAAAEGLGLAKRFLTLTGAPVSLAAIRQGERVIVRLAGDSRQGRAATLVVDDALPAGFEIETVLGPQDGATSGRPGPFAFLGALTPASLQQSRDDRYIAALTVPGRKAFVLAYVVRAVTPGDFFLPGASARDMYHPAIAARTAPGRLIVTPAG